MNDLFLLCRTCGVLCLLADESDDDGLQDVAIFRAAHAEHPLVEARRVADSALFDAPAWDPMATRWFRVAAGGELLHVRSWRSSIDEPRRHALVSGPPQSSERIELDEPLLRRALDRHFYPQAVRPAKVDRFIETVRGLLVELDPRAVPTSFDDPDLPNTGIGPFPHLLRDLLVSRCSRIFDDWELERVRVFIDDHRFEDGALAVRVRRVLDRSAA